MKAPTKRRHGLGGRTQLAIRLLFQDRRFEPRTIARVLHVTQAEVHGALRRGVSTR